MAAPAWQTDELEEEWIEDEDADNEFTQSISLTEPIASHIQTNESHVSSHASPHASTSSEPQPVGTFLVHQSISRAPFLPRTPGNKKGKGIKDFFSPLPLESMFEPPTPPLQPVEPHKLEPVAEEISDMNQPYLKPRPFTFAVPRESFGNHTPPQAESTPRPPDPAAPLTDPPLRLFQFQYDTFTRDHLSAMVDSIAVNTPGGTTPSPTSFHHILSRVSERPSSHDSFSHLRSAKRVKLSPASDYAEGDQISIARPRIYGKDYVGASRSLMQQIREARDFSTVSTVVSARQPPSDGDENKAAVVHLSDAMSKAGPNGVYSSTKFRQKAADLMAQIKNDMLGRKRVFSGDSELSSDHTHRDDKDTVSDKENRSFSRIPSNSSKRSYHDISHGKPPLRIRSARDFVDAVSKLTIDEAPVEPVVVQSVRVEPNPALLTVPQFYPASVHSGTNDDLHRFVSSSTASGTTTLTAGSVSSYVKHSGPAQIRTIAPSDVPSLPQQMGNMYYDKELMKWVKQTGQVAAGRDELGYHLPADDESQDPFEDIESLRDDSRPSRQDEVQPAELSRVEEQSEVDDEEEMELTSFETDNPTGRVVDVMTGIESDYLSSDSDDPKDPIDDLPPEELEFECDAEVLSPELPSVSIPEPPALSVPGPSTGASIPQPNGVLTPSVTPIKSALKSHSVTPSSAIKDQRFRTPMRRGHRRSVSFSDGKRDGPIRGLSRDDSRHDSVGFLPSARSKRIENMMQALGDSDSDLEDDSPSKTYSSGGRPEEIQPLAERQIIPAGRRPFSRSSTHRMSPGNSSRRSVGDATFLTECSFGVAHDHLVQVITDVEPFEPHWDQLTAIDLSSKNIESTARLKEFLPRLDTLNLNSNQLSWLSGVPSSVRTLSVSSNSLTGITSFVHLPNIVSLDISKNDIESINQLRCLRHLRELRADGNKISSIEGLESLDALVKLSLEDNRVRSVDLAQCRWPRLEMLNLGHNCLDKISGLATMASLIALNIDHNCLRTVDIASMMPRLRILRASGNRLSQLDLTPVPHLRTLYLDNNSLVSLTKLERLNKLENLSLRNQNGRGLNLLARDVRDVKRLYLSGNPVGDGFLSEACYNLVYVELAACRLTSLPAELMRLIPNVRVLNLNYNFLEDVGPLHGLTRLRKLSIIGSRLKGTKALIRLIQRMPDLEMLDLRMNPCTLGWYLPLLVKDVPGALQPSEEGGEKVAGWLELDSKFRRDLPDDVYVGRLAYRGLVMRACPRIRMLDGIEIVEKERTKAAKLLTGILGKRPS